MSDDALQRLMSQKRKSVPPRTGELETNFQPPSSNTNVSTLKSSDVNTSLSQDNKANLHLNTVDVDIPLNQDVKADLPQVVRTTTRLEKSVDLALRHLCTEEQITKEVWFEAAYLYLSQNPEAMNRVNNLARERLSHRKRAADIRKFQTMQKRLANKIITEQ